jgi:hypothetical protein
MTGGEFTEVTTPSDLEGVMQRIDALEKRPLRSVTVLSRIDLFRWFLGPALLLAFLEFLLSRILFLRIP